MFHLQKKNNYFINDLGCLNKAGAAHTGEKIAMIFLFAVPAIIVAMKVMFPGLLSLSEFFSLTTLPHSVSSHVNRIMLMSVGAVAVVFFRLTLGFRILGPVRPILIALAYQITGFIVATLFLITIMALFALIRPALRTVGMPYFSRIAIVLSLVALLILVAMKAGLLLGINELLAVGLLPVVVLTFAAEGFARTLYNEGVRSACWRALMTVVLAVGIYMLVSVPGLQRVMLQYPEIILAQMGFIIITTRFMNVKAFKFLNPKPRIRSQNIKKTQNNNKAKVKIKTVVNNNI